MDQVLPPAGQEPLSTKVFGLGILYGIRAIAPLSLLYSLHNARCLAMGKGVRHKALALYALLEGSFLIWAELKVKRNGHDLKEHGHPHVPSMTQQERLTLFRRCLHTVKSPSQFVSSWYHDAFPLDGLRRGNLTEWLAWGLFHQHDVKDLSKDQQQELDHRVMDVEKAIAKERGGNYL